MSLAAPDFTPYYDFRIIENYDTGKFELQTRRFKLLAIGWKTVATSDNMSELEKQAKSLRRGYDVIKEFN